MANPLGINGRPPIQGLPLRNPVYAASKPRRSTSVNFNLALWQDFQAVAKTSGVSAARLLTQCMEECIEAHVRLRRAERQQSEQGAIDGR